MLFVLLFFLPSLNSEMTVFTDDTSFLFRWRLDLDQNDLFLFYL